MKQIKTLSAPILIFIYGIILWSGFGKVGFMNEDFLIILWQNPESFWDCFKSFVVPYGYYYRPVTHIIYAFSQYFIGFKPAFYHWQNIIIHAGSGVAIYYLIKELLDIKWKAVLGSIFFLTLSSHVPATAWIAGRTDAILTTFIMIAFIILHRGYIKGKILNYILAGFFFLLAILSKELAYAGAGLPALLFLNNLDKRSFRVAFWSCFMALVIVGLSLLFRMTIDSNPFTSQNFDGDLSFLKIVQNFFIYIALVFHSPEFWENMAFIAKYKVFQVNTIYSWSYLLLIILLASAFVAAFIAASKSQRKKSLLGISWFSIMLVPALSVTYRWYVFAASVGFILTFVSLIDLRTTKKATRISSYTLLTLIAILIIHNIWYIQLESKSWRKTSDKAEDILNNSKGIPFENYNFVRLWGSPDKLWGNEFPAVRVNLFKTAPAWAVRHIANNRELTVDAPIRSEIMPYNNPKSGQVEYRMLDNNTLEITASYIFFFPKGKQNSSIEYKDYNGSVGAFEYEIDNNVCLANSKLILRKSNLNTDTLELLFIGDRFVSIF
jgi:hypothetical protein